MYMLHPQYLQQQTEYWRYVHFWSRKKHWKTDNITLGKLAPMSPGYEITVTTTTKNKTNRFKKFYYHHFGILPHQKVILFIAGAFIYSTRGLCVRKWWKILWFWLEIWVCMSRRIVIYLLEIDMFFAAAADPSSFVVDYRQPLSVPREFKTTHPYLLGLFNNIRARTVKFSEIVVYGKKILTVFFSTPANI